MFCFGVVVVVVVVVVAAAAAAVVVVLGFLVVFVWFGLGGCLFACLFVFVVCLLLLLFCFLFWGWVFWGFFYNLLAAPQTVSNTYAQLARVQSCANHVQHIGRYMYNMSYAMWYKREAQLCSLTEFISHLFELYFTSWNNNRTGGEETGVPGGNTWRRVSENATY